MTSRLLPIVVAALVALGALTASSLRAEETPVLLTIAGKIEKSNRGQMDEFNDAFLKFREKTFDKALALDLETMSKLGQKAVTAEAEGWGMAVNFEGPALKDILDLAGVADKTVSVLALDGYEVEIEGSQISAHDWVLAMKADGKPLGIGGRGPLWLVYDTAGRKVGEDEEAKWVWSVFFIEVK